MFARWCLLLLVLSPGGCASTKIRANPEPQDKGFRFYRPKPYLFIQPATPETVDLEPNLTYLSLELKMMPDFGEQYSVRIRPGLGDNTTSFKLAEGWNLTEMTFGLDSKTDENIKSAAGFAKAIASKAGAPVSAVGGSARATVLGSNVPLGFYEAVVDRDCNGTKRLYGWRYLGFMPFQSCPTDVAGVDCRDCVASDIYGLVYDQRLNALVFKCLGEIESEPLCVRSAAPIREFKEPKSSAR